MVELAVTAHQRDAIRTLGSAPTELPQDTPSLSHTAIHELSVKLRREYPGNARYSFSYLLRGCSVYIPPPPPKPEPYTALMTPLRREAEEAEYHRLTLPDAMLKGASNDDEFTWKDVKSQVTVIFNVLLSTFATAAAVWLVASSWEPSARLAASFSSGLVVCAAEVVLFGGYIRRMDEAKKAERRKKEVKSIVGLWDSGKANERKE